MCKNIVICCDGTANRFTEESLNTNVIKLYAILKRDDPDKQVIYYDPGVGIVGTGGVSKIYDYFDRATGYGVDDNIKQAYQYLMNSYEAGDRIFLFGFSRGAYTVRSLSGLITRCGLLEKRNINLIDEAFYYYVNRDPKEKKSANTVADEFKANFSRDVKICLIGVWDTVKAIFAGSLKGSLFHDNKLSGNVHYGYQALSIDEHRDMFQPELWDGRRNDEQIVTQVWFSGVHADIGGGYQEDGLSNITLGWMIAQVRKHGLLFKPGSLNKLPAPDPCQLVVHDEYKTGFWFLAGSKHRHIPPYSCIHKSVIDRMNCTDITYRPKNLPSTVDKLCAHFDITCTPSLNDPIIGCA